jgi:hypothetical protein
MKKVLSILVFAFLAVGMMLVDRGELFAQSKKHGSQFRKDSAIYKGNAINDPKQPSYIRGWLKQEQNQRGNDPRKWRNPKGYDVGHNPVNPKDPTKYRFETTHDNRSRGGKFKR